MKPFWRQKTFWTAVAGIAGTVAAYLANEVNMVEAGQAIIGFLALIFLRQGVNTSG